MALLGMATPAASHLPSVSVDKCLAAKVAAAGKANASYAACRGKNAASPDAMAMAACETKASVKMQVAFAKLDAKGACVLTGDGDARSADAASWAATIDATIGGPTSRCNAIKSKVIGKYAAAIAGCYSKAAKKGGVVDASAGGCMDKALEKLLGSVAKAEVESDCGAIGQGATLAASTDVSLASQVCLLDPANGNCNPCGNGVLDAGEQCDPAGGIATACETTANTSAAFACSAECKCACPTTVTFTPDATDPASILDTGWTGIAHRSPFVSDGALSVRLSDCSSAVRPCGTCTVTGPVRNPFAGAGQIDQRRCTNDTAIRCDDDAPCAPGGGSCAFYFGSILPLASGGVSTCVMNQFDGSLSGTADVEGGEVSTVGKLLGRAFNGTAIDHPCPRCLLDVTPNDGVADGVCDAGQHVGDPCDANGSVQSRPDFGETSLDCPPNPAGLLTILPLSILTATDPVVKTLSTSSPNCLGAPGEKCLCDTCNNSTQAPCSSNADCPMSGGNPGVCGGRRCIGGTNEGAPCATVSSCPSGTCGRPGEPSRPGGCLDDTTTVGVWDCEDTDPVDGEGVCVAGPIDQNCSVASGHAQRGCQSDAECGGAPSSCEATPRSCFLTGGLNGRVGTNSLVAAGIEDLPVNDTAAPTLGSVFCVGPVALTSINAVVGLPGPARLTIKGVSSAQP